MLRVLKDRAKRGLFNAFELGQRVGVDILPRHFYSQIPAIRELRGAERWRQARNVRSIPGSSIEHQLSFARSVCRPDIMSSVHGTDVHAAACRANGVSGYGPIEAVFLHAFICAYAPRRIVQVGAGVSTAIMLEASRRAGYQPEIVCIDPFPTAYLSEAASKGQLKLIAKPAQEVIGEQSRELGKSDLLFVDSTHTVKPGSEVNTIILDVLPELASGVWVHFHDITLPYDYSPQLLDGELFFWNESALLHAFLSCNARFELCASLSMLHHGAQAELRELIAGYEPMRNSHGLQLGPGHFPSSAYLRAL